MAWILPTLGLISFIASTLTRVPAIATGFEREGPFGHQGSFSLQGILNGSLLCNVQLVEKTRSRVPGRTPKPQQLTS